jgi:hypothetical protein
MATHTVIYDSIAAALAARPTEQNRDIVEGSYAKHRGETSWFGPECNSAEDALALFARGWSDGVARLSELRADSTFRPRSIRRRRVWCDQGDAVDIHRVYAGRLDQAWQRATRQTRAGSPRVSIVASLSISAGQTTSDLFWRGAAVCRLSDVLSEAGYSVEIIGLKANARLGEDGGHGVHAIPLKASEQPLDLANIAAALCHSGFGRSACYNMLGTYPRRCRGNFGYPNEAQPLLEAYAAEHCGDGAIVAPYDLFSQHAAQVWLDAQIARIQAAEHA